MSERQGKCLPKGSHPGKHSWNKDHRILVVDDDGLVRGLIQTILSQQGYRPTLCADGPSALRRIAQESWSLLIIDLHMPQLSGLEVIQRIRADGNELPAILISGMMTDEAAEECHRLGRTAFLSKPFEVSSLLRLVARLIS